MERILSLMTSFLLMFGLANVDTFRIGLKPAWEALIHKKEISQTRYQGEKSTYRWEPTTPYRLEDTVVLKKDKNKDFTILNFTDCHFADYDGRTVMANTASMVMAYMVKKVKPDLITVTGDMVCESTAYSIRRFTALMDSFGIPWAPVFGNHDDEGNCDAAYLADEMQKSSLCLMQKGDSRFGVGNYIINIVQEENGKQVPVQSLIMMDSHHGGMNEGQVDWYRWAAKGICEISGKEVESTVFLHVPLAQYQYAYEEAWDSRNKRWREGYEAAGELHEAVCCARDKDGKPVDNGLFDAVKEIGMTKNIICGHEHMNDFSILYQGVRLTYTMKVGKGSGFQPLFNGATEIKISSDRLSSITHKTIYRGDIMKVNCR